MLLWWDFNNGYTVADLSPQIVHNASTGAGVIYQQRGDTDGNGKAGNTFVDAGNGINATAGQAMAWDDIAKAGVNDAEFFIVFSTVGMQGVTLSFDIRGNATIIPSFDLKYSTSALADVTNPPDVVGTIKDFAGGISTEHLNNQAMNAVASYQRIVVDLSSVSALNDQATVAIRLDDFANGTGNNDMRIDNVLITATAIPETSTSLVSLFGLVLFMRRRR